MLQPPYSPKEREEVVALILRHRCNSTDEAAVQAYLGNLTDHELSREFISEAGERRRSAVKAARMRRGAKQPVRQAIELLWEHLECASKDPRDAFALLLTTLTQVSLYQQDRENALGDELKDKIESNGGRFRITVREVGSEEHAIFYRVPNGEQKRLSFKRLKNIISELRRAAKS